MEITMKKKLILAVIAIYCSITITMGQEYYYCDFEEKNNYRTFYGGPISSETLHRTAEEACSGLENFGEFYENCCDAHSYYQKAFRKGNCEPIITKKVIVDDCKCTVGLLQSSERLVCFQCYGENEKNAEEKIKKMYKYDSSQPLFGLPTNNSFSF